MSLILIIAIAALIYFYKKLLDINNNIQNENEALKNKYAVVDDLEEEQKKLNDLKANYQEKYQYYKELSEKVDLYKNEEKYIDCGIYEQIYNFTTSAQFKQEINAVKTEQKILVKEDRAVICNTDFILQGSLSDGQKMIKKEKDLLIKAFNSICDKEIDNIKWNNIGLIKNRILITYKDINKVGEFHDLKISDKYLNLKQKQVQLIYEYQQKLYQEREEQRALREQEKEEAKRRIEEEQRAKKIAEDEKRAKELEEKIRQAKEEGRQEAADAFEQEKTQLYKIIDENKRILSRWEQGYRDGYVYVISNIGSFGENIYKIGMTTRADDPETKTTGAQKRVSELNNASVPFKFFIHAAIYTENAPELESKLHNHFDYCRVNKINLGKEFFNVSLEEIKKAVNEITKQDITFKEPWDLSYNEDEWNQDYLQTIEILKRENPLPIENQYKQEPEALPQSI